MSKTFRNCSTPNLRAVKLMEVTIREHLAKYFGYYLLPTMTDLIFNLKKDTKRDDEVIADYKVPLSLCRQFSLDNKPIMSTASLLALFDNFSTYIVIAADKTHRPGASVHLELEVFDQIHADSDIQFTSKVEKLGKYIGFSSVEVHKGKSLVARGKHIKFMPGPWWWDLLISPIVFPVVGTLYDAFRARKFATPLDSIIGFSSSAVDSSFPDYKTNELSYTFKSLNLLKQTVDNASNDNRTFDNAKPKSFYQMRVREDLTNGLGPLHGGAMAIAAEESCYQHYEDLLNKHAIHIKCIDLKYLSPVRGEFSIEISEDVHSPFLQVDGAVIPARSRVIGCARDKKNKQVLVEFSCIWEQVRASN